MVDVPGVPSVAEVMSSPVMTAEPSDTIADASARMRDHSVGSIVVCDGERPIGILTERDLIRFSATGVAAADTKVSEWMTGAPDCAAPELSVQEALAHLESHPYRHLPVTEGDRLVGIVSLRDLMHLAQIQPVVQPGTTLQAGSSGRGDGALAPWIIGGGIAALALVLLGGLLLRHRTQE